MNNLIIFATYWNEIDWIEASLKQIKKLDPIEIIICDGCFDPKVPNYSTDGTREIIAKWLEKRKNARMISAIRLSKVKGCLRLLKGFQFPNFIHLYISAIALRKSVYRINQALTFNHMIKLATKWQPDRWFMTMDADQFYPDLMIEQFKKYINTKNELGLLTGKERTFFNNFENYTEDYEKRIHNNMPHKIYSNTFIRPTRELILEHPLYFKYYKDEIPTKNVGKYNQYKFKPNNPERLTAGYKLGDRKPPKRIDTFEFKTFEGKHPSSIQYILESRLPRLKELR